jgi:hypothetical protein
VSSAWTRLALLLGADLGPHDDADAPAPLDPARLTRVLAWAAKTGATDSATMAELGSAPADAAHLSALLGRRARLDRALSDWSKAGIWVIGRDEPAYPRRLRRRLRGAAPVLLFGRGDPAALARGGIALVAGAEAAPDRIAGALDSLGRLGMTAILDRPPATATTGPVILLDQQGGLEGRWMSAGARLGLAPPGAASASTPGDRARIEACRYGLADAALLLGLRRNDPAWPGAVAAIDRERLPVWCADGDAASLVRAGANLLPPGPIAPAELLRPLPSPAAKRARAQAASEPARDPRRSERQGFAEGQAGFGPGVSHLRLVAGGARSDALPAFTQDQAFYALFESRLATLLAHGPLGVVRIAAVMGLTRPQTEAWLLRAEAGGLVRRDPETGLFAWEPA